MPKLSTFESFMIATVLSFVVALIFKGLLYLAETQPYILVDVLSALSALASNFFALIALSCFVWIVYQIVQRLITWIRN